MRQPLLLLLALVAIVQECSIAKGDLISNATLTFSLDGNAFANGADAAFLAGLGVNLTPGQSFMEFAGHNASAPPGRPASIASVPNFATLRPTWVRPDSSNLAYGFNSNPTLQTLSFDPAVVSTTGATGTTRFTGGSSFWFANDAVIATNSVWIQYGNLTLGYDASRIGGSNSGWLFANNLAGTLNIFDVRNPTINATAASIGSPGSFTMSGDLFTAPEFRAFLGIQSGIDVGGFTLSAVTVVPEPTAMSMVLITGIGTIFSQRRRSQKYTCQSLEQAS